MAVFFPVAQPGQERMAHQRSATSKNWPCYAPIQTGAESEANGRMPATTCMIAVCYYF